MKCFEFEAQSDDALQDNMNDWEKDEDHEEAKAYTAAAATTMKGGKEGDSCKLPSFKVTKVKVINIISLYMLKNVWLIL